MLSAGSIAIGRNYAEPAPLLLWPIRRLGFYGALVASPQSQPGLVRTLPPTDIGVRRFREPDERFTRLWTFSNVIDNVL